MRTTKKTAAFAALLVAGFMLVGAACGGSSSKSSESSGGSSSESSSATSKSSGGDAKGCAELFNKTEELSASMDALDSGSTGDMNADMDAMVKALESFSSNVPSEIRDDWKTIVSAIKEYVAAIEDIDMSDVTKLTDPATMEKLEKAGAALQSQKYMEASEKLDQWTQKNCPGFDF